ncbi:hypothetical protein B0H15DRAFT_313315 [Mycena belliarum]|uniref:Secreted protein n=1 Tax=Mycena belliarum TaxID=1033014 RepID=A0AAD6UFQ5_9AGAR|nr:hypothetical protein B0H15DRAFT_313315 [Mycena belliae]
MPLWLTFWCLDIDTILCTRVVAVDYNYYNSYVCTRSAATCCFNLGPRRQSSSSSGDECGVILQFYINLRIKLETRFCEPNPPKSQRHPLREKTPVSLLGVLHVSNAAHRMAVKMNHCR